MLSPADRPLFEAARAAQLNRNTAISLITNPQTRDAALNCFVRVLLELPTRQEDYVVARVESMIEGELYSGFSTVPTQMTRTYLVLHLPRQLAVINGTQYQLNSVSNSGMREFEFARWLELMRQEGSVDMPTVVDLQQVAERLRQTAAMASHPRLASPPHVVVPPAAQPVPQSAVAPMVPSSKAVPSTNIAQRQPVLTSVQSRLPGGGPEAGPTRAPLFSNQQEVGVTAPAARPSTAMPNAPVGGAASSSTKQQAPVLQSSASASARNETEDEKMTRKLRQEVMNQLATESVLFPRDLTGFKLSRLRLTERDMVEYLQHVQEEIASKQENCVVCMDRVPTVILLPCKHKVMCRLCATSVATCPVCRSLISEMFEPEEI